MAICLTKGIDSMNKVLISVFALASLATAEDPIPHHPIDESQIANQENLSDRQRDEIRLKLAGDIIRKYMKMMRSTLNTYDVIPSGIGYRMQQERIREYIQEKSALIDLQTFNTDKLEEYLQQHPEEIKQLLPEQSDQPLPPKP